MDYLPELLSLFISAFLAATLIPAQSELLIAALNSTGNYNPATLVVFATVGNVLGSVVNWGIGWHIIKIKKWKYFPFKDEQIDKASMSYKKWGVWTLLLAWVPIIGDPLTLVAGIFRTNFWIFLILVTIGKALRYIGIVMIT